VAIFGNLFGQIFGDSAAELEAQGDYFAGVNNWKRATEEYRRALQRTNKTSIGYRRLAAKFDDARLRGFDTLVEEIHSHIDVREFTYASDQLTVARGLAETDAQRERLDECERRLKGAGRGSLPAAANAAEAPRMPSGSRSSEIPAARVDASRPEPSRADAAAPLPDAMRSEVSRSTERPLPGVRPAANLAPEARSSRDSSREPSLDPAYQKVLSRLPAAEAAARVRLGTHYRDAVMAFTRGDATRSVELFQRACDAMPEEPIIQYDLAASLAAAGRAREAQTVYLEIAEHDRKDWQPYYEIAQLQWAEGLRDQALATLEGGLQRHPRSGYLMAQWGVLLHKMGDKRAALERFYEALQLDSFDDAGLYHVIANLHLELGDLDRARRGYLKALELRPSSIGTMLDYAEFLIEQKQDAASAQAILDTAFRALRTQSGTKLHYAYRSYLASRAHMLLGEREMALLDVTRALEENDQAWLEDTLEAQRQAVLTV